ncbi:MAG: sensor histidine kinase [Polyangiaceae bacterium]
MVLATGTGNPGSRPAHPGSGIPQHPYPAALAAVGVCTLIAAEGKSVLQTSAFALVFPLAVLLVAVRFGRGPAIVASVAGVIACDFVIVPPAMAFAVPNLKDGLTLLVMTAVAAAISLMVERLRRKAFLAERHAGIEGLRNTMLSALSHDLRTPLAALVSASTALNESAVDVTMQPQLVRMVASEAVRLNRLVSALFNLTRLQARVSPSQHELQSIDELIGCAFARLESQLAGNPVRIEVPEETPLIACDPVLIEEVLVNLLENAVRYAGPDSPVEVSAWGKNGEMIVQVADLGPGVPPGDEERVFEKHYRGVSARPGEGLGMGLAICRAIVGAHEGRIWLQNREGGGARVTIRLPLRRAAFEEGTV